MISHQRCHFILLVYKELAGYDGMGSIIEAVYHDDEVPTSGSSAMIIQVFTGYERTLMPKWNLIHHERQMIYIVFHPFKQLYWYLCVTYKQLLVGIHG